MARARAKWGKRVGGEGAWSGGRGFVSGNPRQIKQFNTPRYTVEQCAADSKRCAGTAAHHTGAGVGAGAGAGSGAGAGAGAAASDALPPRSTKQL